MCFDGSSEFRTHLPPIKTFYSLANRIQCCQESEKEFAMWKLEKQCDASKNLMWDINKTIWWMRKQSCCLELRWHKFRISIGAFRAKFSPCVTQKKRRKKRKKMSRTGRVFNSKWSNHECFLFFPWLFYFPVFVTRGPGLRPNIVVGGTGYE